jgi:hypothetical protein
MIFIDNKYTKIYYNIINSAKATSPMDGYLEQHHIIPKSLGGLNTVDNLINLTARQHFVCHWLLTKMVVGKDKKKMIFAINRMLSATIHQQRYKITGRKYELLKIQFSKINPFNDKDWQKLQRKNNHIGKKRSEESKQKLRDAWAKNRENRIGINHPSYGKVRTKETLKKMSESMKGKLVKEKNPMYGKTHSIEVKNFLSERLLKNPIPKKYIYCEYCDSTIDAGNYKRWHGDVCKLKN